MESLKIDYHGLLIKIMMNVLVFKVDVIMESSQVIIVSDDKYKNKAVCDGQDLLKQHTVS